MVSISSVRSSALGNLTLSVSSTLVTVTSLQVTVVQAITLSGVSSSISANGSYSAIATIQQQLTQEFQSAYVHVFAVTSDGAYMPVTVSNGLNLTSLGTNVIQISGQNIIAVGSGSGALVSAQLGSGVCSNATVGYGLGNISANLPLPTGAEIVVSTSRLSVAGDPATLVGLGTQISLTINLIYAGGRRQAMTNDSRTIIDAASLDPSNVINITRGALNMPSVVANGPSGSGTLLVKFTHVSVNATNVFTVVLAQSGSISSSPYPSFANSDSVSDTVLNLIGETGAFQQIYLKFGLTLSDSSVTISGMIRLT